MSQPKRSQEDNSVEEKPKKATPQKAKPATAAALRKKLMKGGGLLHQDEYTGTLYTYKDEYMWYIRLEEGKIKTAATMRDNNFDMHMSGMITKPTLRDVKPLPKDIAEEIKKKISGNPKHYVKLAAQDALMIGGGMTTEMSFSFTPQDDASALDAAKRVLNPESFGYFIFYEIPE